MRRVCKQRAKEQMLRARHVEFIVPELEQASKFSAVSLHDRAGAKIIALRDRSVRHLQEADVERDTL